MPYNFGQQPGMMYAGGSPSFYGARPQMNIQPQMRQMPQFNYGGMNRFAGFNPMQAPNRFMPYLQQMQQRQMPQVQPQNTWQPQGMMNIGRPAGAPMQLQSPVQQQGFNQPQMSVGRPTGQPMQIAQPATSPFSMPAMNKVY